LKSGQVKEAGKEAFNQQKKEILKRNYERPVHMECDRTAEPPTKKRKTTNSTSYQSAQPIPPRQGFFSIGNRPLAKKQREMNARKGKVVGSKALGKPSPNYAKGGYFCVQHERHHANSISMQKFPSSFPAFAGSAPGPSNPYMQQFCGCVPDPSNLYLQQLPGSIPRSATHTT
jgi:hypothetical protein